MTTKILALTDALGNLVRFVLLPGQRYDTMGVAPLIEGIEFGALIADKAFDANWIIAEMNTRGAGIVISQRPNRLNPIPIDLERYKWRHLIENFFWRKVRPYSRRRREPPMWNAVKLRSRKSCRILITIN